MHKAAKQMKECIDVCNHCREECEEMLYQHCLEMGGDHLEPDHVRLMADCIQACQLAVSFMLRDSEHANDACRLCANVCEDCATSCAQLGDKDMEECADLCQHCADVCREMSERAQNGSLPAGGMGIMA